MELTVMRVLHVKADINVSSGGPSYSTINLCRSLSRHGLDITLFTSEPVDEVPPGTGQGFHVQYFKPSWPHRLHYSSELVAALKASARQFDVLDIHGLWNLTTTRAACTAEHLGIPYVLTPRGMISAWQREASHVHKEVFWHLCAGRAVRRASLVRFLTRDEMEMSVVHAGPMRHVVIPNGVWLEDFDDVRPYLFREKLGLGEHPCVVFLGRLHPIKRLDLQCAAFTLLANDFPDLHWIFIGPDNGVLRNLKRSMDTAGLSDRSHFTGLLTGEDRLSALAAATVYCHTSDHEGHSVAITEALAAGRPCVVTKACHYDEIAVRHAGYVVESKPEAIAEAIRSILAEPTLASSMAKNARSLAAEKYSWNAVALQVVRAYRLLLEGDHL